MIHLDVTADLHAEDPLKAAVYLGTYKRTNEVHKKKKPFCIFVGI
jgi:hypothetical protein